MSTSVSPPPLPRHCMRKERPAWAKSIYSFWWIHFGDLFLFSSVSFFLECLFSFCLPSSFPLIRFPSFFPSVSPFLFFLSPSHTHKHTHNGAVYPRGLWQTTCVRERSVCVALPLMDSALCICQSSEIQLIANPSTLCDMVLCAWSLLNLPEPLYQQMEFW